MEQKERIILLAKLYKSYLEELHEYEKDLYNSIRKENPEAWEIDSNLRVVADYTQIVDQLVDWMRNEDVMCIYDDKENEKMCIDTRNYGTLELDGLMGEPFRIDFPINFIYEDKDEQS